MYVGLTWEGQIGSLHKFWVHPTPFKNSHFNPLNFQSYSRFQVLSTLWLNEENNDIFELIHCMHLLHSSKYLELLKFVFFSLNRCLGNIPHSEPFSVTHPQKGWGVGWGYVPRSMIFFAKCPFITPHLLITTNTQEWVSSFRW